MKAKKVSRKGLYITLLTTLYKAKAGHIGSSLSCLDITKEVLMNQMRKGDRFVFSKGHAAPTLYTILHAMGRMSNKDLSTFHVNGTKYPAHPPAYLDKMIPFPSGSLGHGLSIACGTAQGFMFLHEKSREKIPTVFCLMSDGECNEGQVWEAVQYAVAKKLSNLVVLIDSNKLQAFGKTVEVLGNSAALEKWKVFGFETYRCDGNNPKEIKKTFLKLNHSHSTKPKVIILDTIKGYGVNFMENKLEWHYNTLTEELYQKALASINKKIKE